MAIQNQYQVVFNTASGTNLIQLGGNMTMHTLNFPKATSGVVYLTTGVGSGTTILWTIPAASIGSLRFDCSLVNGLAIGAVAADAYAVTWQTP